MWLEKGARERERSRRGQRGSPGQIVLGFIGCEKDRVKETCWRV